MDTKKEIHFFKYLKPKFVAKFIFLSKVVAFYSGLPYGGDRLVKKKIETEFETMRIFSEDNSEFINYYRRQSTYLDKKYFLRFQYDLYVRLSLDLHSFDDRRFKKSLNRTEGLKKITVFISSRFLIQTCWKNL